MNIFYDAHDISTVTIQSLVANWPRIIDDRTKWQNICHQVEVTKEVVRNLFQTANARDQGLLELLDDLNVVHDIAAYWHIQLERVSPLEAA
jgi:hypothetical protein